MVLIQFDKATQRLSIHGTERVGTANDKAWEWVRDNRTADGKVTAYPSLRQTTTYSTMVSYEFDIEPILS